MDLNGYGFNGIGSLEEYFAYDIDEYCEPIQMDPCAELLAGALVGDWTSAQSQAFDAGGGGAPCHGELIVAFDPQRFAGDAAGRLAGDQAAEAMFASITGQGAPAVAAAL